MKRHAAPLVLAAAYLSGCNPQYENPFQTQLQTVAPPAGADLVVAIGGGVLPELREIYALSSNGSLAPTRLSDCTFRSELCDIVEIAPAPDRQRVAVRRRRDVNGDGKINANEPEVKFVIDLQRGIEGEILSTSKGVRGLLWTALDPPLFFSGTGAGDRDDIFESTADGTQVQNVSASTEVDERYPRIRGALLTFEHQEPDRISQVWGAVGIGTGPIAAGDATLEPVPLPGTPYRVGSDASGDPSPDVTHVVFRRLTGIGDGRGTWDIYTIALDGTDLKPVATGAMYRGEPVWGAPGIAFVESASGSKTASLVLVDSAGARHVLIADAPSNLQSPRWLP